MSYFSCLEELPLDPILGIPLLFAADTHPHKVNLGIGAYKDQEGHPLVLRSVRQAEFNINEKKLNKEYLPIEGDSHLNQLGLKLLFGENNPLIESGELVAAQTIGGTGALRIGAELLKRLTKPLLYLSNPSWPNHHQIFEKSGFEIRTYPYRHQKTNQLDFIGFCESIKKMDKGSVILLHACCHNPTGIDPTPVEWRELSLLIKHQQLLPFFDCAYQGFGENLAVDSYAIRYFASQGHEMFISQSYAKNFGIYNDRVGLLIIRSRLKESMAALRSQVKYLIRCNYSSPPAHGALIVTEILNSPILKTEWEEELKSMRTRIALMRQEFADRLKGHDMGYLAGQNGLFSFLNLSPVQVLQLRKEKGIYMLENGRINIAGLNANNLDYVAESILAVQ